MGSRTKKNTIGVLATKPWSASIFTSIIGFISVRHSIQWFLSHHGGMPAQSLAQQSGSIFALLAWLLLLGICWMTAKASYLSARKRRRFLDTRNTLESLAAEGRRQFEQLVAEAFLRKGYAAKENELSGPDGGIDILLRKYGQRTLVPCKQWKRQQVGVSTIREMAELHAHHQAQAVRVVCIGGFTLDPAAFARGKPIELIEGEQLLAMMQAAKAASNSPASHSQRIAPRLSTSGDPEPKAPAGLLCGNALAQRVTKNNEQGSLGCSASPNCRATN